MALQNCMMFLNSIDLHLKLFKLLVLKIIPQCLYSRTLHSFDTMISLTQNQVDKNLIPEKLKGNSKHKAA